MADQQIPPIPSQAGNTPQETGNRKSRGLIVLGYLNVTVAILTVLLAWALVSWADMGDWATDLYQKAASGRDVDPTVATSPVAQTKVIPLKSNRKDIAVTSAAMLSPAILLLIVSGIGYSRQSKGLGYVIGTICGVAGILGSVGGMINGGLSLLPAGLLAYSILTIILLNTAFRHSWK